MRHVVTSALKSGDFRSFRCVVAFARWSGVSLLAPDLNKFLEARKRNSCEFIVGVDLGGTTAEALDYLLHLPKSKVHILRSGDPRIVFHPKIYSFDGPKGWMVVVGSSNLTTGGLFTNGEASVVLRGKTDEANPIETIWDYLLRPGVPLESTNVRRLTDEYLAELAPELAALGTRSPDQAAGGGGSGGIAKIPLAEPVPLSGRPPSPGARDAGRPSPVMPPSKAGQVLYMELWEETGGGTQVQMPKRVFTSYFGASDGTVTWVTLNTPEGTARVRLQSFDNSTYRLPLAFVHETPRPAVLVFDRVGTDEYNVGVWPKGVRGYAKRLNRCDQQSRHDSKRFGFR